MPFQDDDVILKQDYYLGEILKAYVEKPASVGVQDYAINAEKRPRFWRRIFFLGNKVSPVGHAPGRDPIHTAEVHGLYLFDKLFAPTFGNRMIHWWIALGRMAGRMKRLWHVEFAAFGHHQGAFLFCWRHWREIKTDRLEFVDRAFGNGKESP